MMSDTGTGKTMISNEDDINRGAIEQTKGYGNPSLKESIHSGKGGWLPEAIRHPERYGYAEGGPVNAPATASGEYAGSDTPQPASTPTTPSPQTIQAAQQTPAQPVAQPTPTQPIASADVGEIVPQNQQNAPVAAPDVGSNEEETVNDIVKEYGTKAHINEGYSHGQLTKPIAVAAMAKIDANYQAADDATKKAMAQAEHDAETGQNSKAPVAGSDIGEKVIPDTVPVISQESGGQRFGQTMAQEFLGQQTPIGDAARAYLQEQHTPDEIQAAMGKFQEAQNLLLRQYRISDPKTQIDLQRQIRSLLTDLVPDYMALRSGQAGWEAEYGGQKILKNIGAVGTDMFGSGKVKPFDPNGDQVSAFERTPEQDANRLDAGKKAYDDYIASTTIVPKNVAEERQLAVLQKHGMAPSPEAIAGAPEWATDAGLALVGSGLVPVLGINELALEGVPELEAAGMTARGTTLQAAVKGAVSRTGGAFSRAGEWAQPVGAKLAGKSFGKLLARTAVGGTLGTGWYIFDPFTTNKLALLDPSNPKHWQALMEYARDAGIPSLIGGVGGLTLNRVGWASRILGDTMRAADEQAFVPSIQGQSIRTGASFMPREGIMGDIFGPERTGPVNIPFMEAAPRGIIRTPAIQLGGRTLRSAIEAATSGVPYSALTSKDTDQFLQNVENFGYLGAIVHAPVNFWNAIKGTFFNPAFVGRGQDPNRPPPWGLSSYGDRYDNVSRMEFDRMDKSRQNAFLYQQGFGDANGIKTHLLPPEVVTEVARNLGQETTPRGFTIHNPISGETHTFISSEHYDPASGHEFGHNILDTMHPTDQARMMFLASRIPDSEMNDFVTRYANEADPSVGPITFSQLPTESEIKPGSPDYDKEKADFAARTGNLTQEQAKRELAADTIGQWFGGQTAEKWLSKNPALMREASMLIGSGLEGMGIRSTTADINGPVGAPKYMLFGKTINKYVKGWVRGLYSGANPILKLPGGLEKEFQAQEAEAREGRQPLPEPTEEQIAKRAYGISQKRPAGGAQTAEEAREDWLQAQKELRAQIAAAPRVRVRQPPGPPAAPSGPQPGPGVLKGLIGAFHHAHDSKEAHDTQWELKKKGLSPGEAQAISEGRTPTPGPANPSLMPGGNAGVKATPEAVVKPAIPTQHPARERRQNEAKVAKGNEPQDYTSKVTNHKLIGVTGSEFGEVDNPKRGGYTEPGWNIGAWGDRLDGENNHGFALPPSILRHLGWTGQHNYGQLFNSQYTIRVHNPRTGATTEGPLKDIGPGAKTGALIDMLWGSRHDLGYGTNFKGGVNFEIVDKKGNVVYAPTGHEVEEGGGGGGGGGGGRTGVVQAGGGAGGVGSAPIAPGAPGTPEFEAQQRPTVIPGTQMPEPEQPAARPAAYTEGPSWTPAPEQSGMMPMGGYMGPGAQMTPYGFMPPPAAPSGQVSMMPARGPKQLGGKYGETEEEPSTANNGPVANAAVAPHLAKGTLKGLEDAQIAHAAELSDDDLRVQKQPDGFFKGEYFQRGDALHSAVLKNVPDKEKEVMAKAEEAIANRQPLNTTYASAPRKGLEAEAPTTRSRQIEYEMSSPQARLLKQTTAQLAGHTMIPTAVGVKLAAKKGAPHEGYVQGISTNAVANNHWHINQALTEAGHASPYPTLDKKFMNDLEGYISNLNAGYRGTGTSLQPSTKAYQVKVDPRHVAYRIKPEEAEYMNMLINNQAARAKKAGPLRELARAGGTLYTEEGETNPLRLALDMREAKLRHEAAAANPENPELKKRLEKRWSEDTLEPTIRTFKAGLVHETHGSQEAMPEAIRPGEEFKDLTTAMQRHLPRGRPDVPVSVNFMPGRGHAPEFKSVSPEEFITQRNKSKRPQYLSELSPHEIREHQLYTSHDGTSGVAIDPHGDIQNVFNNGGPQGAGAHAVVHAIANGGRTLDAYDPYLPEYYRQFGFNETGRMKFNPTYAKPEWDFKKDDEPDVVFMGWKGYPNGDRDAAIARATRQAEKLPNEPSAQYYPETDWDRAKDESRAYARGAEAYRMGREGPEEEAYRSGNPPSFGAGPTSRRDLAESPAPAFMPMAGRAAKGFRGALKAGKLFETPIQARPGTWSEADPDLEFIRQTLGFPPPEGRPGPWSQQRFEISDRDMKLKPSPAKSPFPSLLEHQSHLGAKDQRLGDVLDHPELFKNYPQLANTKIELAPNIKGEGYYSHPWTDPDTGEHKGDRLVLKDASDRNTLAHEIQHAVQNIEGHPPGASFEAIHQSLLGSLPIINEVGKEAMAEYPDMSREAFIRNTGGGSIGLSKKDLDQQYTDYQDTMSIHRRDWILRRMRDIAFALYQRTPGEMEARAAGYRAATPESKRSPARQLEWEKEATNLHYPIPPELERSGTVPPWAQISFMAARKKKGEPEPPRELSEATKAKLGPVPTDPHQAMIYQRVGERLDTQIPGAIPLEPAYTAEGKFRWDATKKAPVYKTTRYDIANAPMLQQQGKAMGTVTDSKGKVGPAKAPPETRDELESLDPEKRLTPFLNPTDRKRVVHLNKISAVNAYADKLYDFYKSIEHLPEVMGGKEWYDEAKGLLDKNFGSHASLMANLLGATSAGNKVKINYNMAINAYHNFLMGRYDRAIDLYRQAYGIKQSGKGNLIKHIIENKIHEKLKDKEGNPEEAPDSDEAAMDQWIRHHDITPRNEYGKLFGHNSIAVLKVLAHTWEKEAGGPKTPNFAANLDGRSIQATIDMWAARTMRRLGYEGYTDKPWLIQPAGETGVSDVDFGLSQLAFRKAAERIGIKPSSLQAILWFAEQKHWQANKWERAQDAEDRDYRPMLKAYKHPEGVPHRSTKKWLGEKEEAPAAPG
jgi:hypothetical protein